MQKIKRIAVLWRHVTGYVQAALNEILAEGVEILLIQNRQEVNARFPLQHKHCHFLEIGHLASDDQSWQKALTSFSPQIALISDSKDKRYQQAAYQLKQSGCLTIWATDRILRVPLQDSYQRIRGQFFGAYRHYSAASVPGFLTMQYAMAVGFPPDRIFRGLYTCDTKLYRPIGITRQANSDPYPPVFLFIGQLIERKGIDILLQAYEMYRRQAGAKAWQLHCIGRGTFASLLKGKKGVTHIDFSPPAKCAELMGQAGAFILPSRWDHWGVVVHEAACAGLPILASQGCGSIVELVQDGVNGFTFPINQVDPLIGLLKEISRYDQDKLALFGKRSLEMSRRFDPKIFKDMLLNVIPNRLQFFA